MEIEYGLSARNEMQKAGFEGSPHLATDGQFTRCGLHDESGERSTARASRNVGRAALLSDHHLGGLDGNRHRVVYL